MTESLPVSPDFEGYSKEFLDDLLTAFYPSIRKANGTWFSKSSYICFRAAIQRHLSAAPWNVPYLIINDLAFKNSNEVLEGIFKKLSREGKDRVKHHQPIEGAELEKLRTTGTIGTNNPLALLRFVWLNIALHFARRGREGYRYMTKTTFIVGVDGEGRRFIEHTFCEKTKNHQGVRANDSYRPQGRLYEVEGDDFCPVRAFELYLSLLNVDLDCLWQKPNPRFLDSGNWYIKLPMGHNTLGKMMSSMCKDAQLTNTYTNHCTRVTTSVILNDQGFNETDIVKVTGHKSTSSLKSYNNRATTSQKRQMSDAINKQMCKKMPKQDKENIPASSSSENIAVLECDDLQEFNDIEMCNIVANYEKEMEKR